MKPKKEETKKVMTAVTINGAKIIYRNLSGKPGDYNIAGNRNFSVLLDDDQASILKEIGWNVKYTKPRNEEDISKPHLPVKVAYGKYPPQIFLVTEKAKRELSESSVHLIDTAEIENVDLIIKPYNWEKGPDTGVKAYVKEMYVTIKESDLAKKYASFKDSNQSPEELDEND